MVEYRAAGHLLCIFRYLLIISSSFYIRLLYAYLLVGYLPLAGPCVAFSRNLIVTLSNPVRKTKCFVHVNQ